ncbi:MAG: zinc ABC transporter substrate-binding protein [Candidatus Goldbacteria bacterium]|nr:zinc ABC transporter substrate-binding protein [Candidatus Goldiibacteriota bacterium]
MKKYDEEVILCGTSIIASIVRDITGSDKIKTLIPHLSCPGTYDLKPEDAKLILKSKIIILHPFQKYLADKISNINKEIKIIYISSKDLNTPDGYINGLNEVLDFLLQTFPYKKEYYLKNNETIKLKIKSKIAPDMIYINEIKNKKIKVLSSIHHKAFCEYIGFYVIDVFAGPNSLKPQDTMNLIEKAKKEKVKYIISNLTGDNDITADILNKYLKVKKVVLMYFPTQEGADTWFFNLYNYNLEQIKSLVQ